MQRQSEKEHFSFSCACITCKIHERLPPTQSRHEPKNIRLHERKLRQSELTDRNHKHADVLWLVQSRTQSLQAFWSAGQRREDSGDIKFYYRRISAVKQWKPLRNSQSKKLNFFDVPRVFPALPRWPKSLKTLGTRLWLVTSRTAPHEGGVRDVSA